MPKKKVVHAEDSGTAASEVRASARPPRDRHVARHRQQNGERLRAAGKRGGLLLAVGGGTGRRRAGGGAVSPPAAVAGSTGAALGRCPPGASSATRVYSRFCDRYRGWCGRLIVVLRQVYRAGAKAFVEYEGPTVTVNGRKCHRILAIDMLGRAGELVSADRRDRWQARRSAA